MLYKHISTRNWNEIVNMKKNWKILKSNRSRLQLNWSRAKSYKVRMYHYFFTNFRLFSCKTVRLFTDFIININYSEETAVFLVKFHFKLFWSGYFFFIRIRFKFDKSSFYNISHFCLNFLVKYHWLESTLCDYILVFELYIYIMEK